MTPATAIQNYLLLHLHREFPGIDVWRANVVGRRPGVSVVAAGEPGQADLTGVWGGRCRACGQLSHDSDPLDLSQHWTVSIIDRLEELERSAHDFTPTGRSIWIEVKSPGDSQSDTQQDFERRVTRLGALYIICRVRKRETMAAIREYLGAPKMVRDAAVPRVHPAEIQTFFDELRAAL